MCDTASCFFGYGSLVNLRTHNYQNPQTGRISGWRRVWRSARNGDISFLSIEPYDGEISGMFASTAGIGWDALDLRERGYARQSLPKGCIIGTQPDSPAMIYVGAPNAIDPSVQKPILLSYLDVVVQGFHVHFGRQGVADFFNSTAQWARPVLDDRAAPIYPRAQELTLEQQQLVDENLERLPQAHLVRDLSVSF
ncbi:gamma-glutamylcyclotransferase [Amylibacter marinus]|uniref:Gamma-glutamylcyclotransferase n=1 Tax=Amylibacter marinus TaxID=1475483 RepID=A0ABQ5VTJ1_9RHOB|nr:gamma-glutamylcyclotransferase family protein [Amylibacter marinus]GLQ34469.1 gamma-glutamylcyclotransferase [Amylibacter marinus]